MRQIYEGSPSDRQKISLAISRSKKQEEVLVTEEASWLPFTDHFSDSVDPAKVLEHQELVTRMENLLADLPFNVRTAMKLHYKEGKSCREIAVALTKTEKEIKNMINRTMTTLRNPKNYWFFREYRR